MNATITYTLHGWFWFVPILAALEDDVCAIEARYRWMEPLLGVADFFEGWRITMSCLLWDDYEPSFQFRLAELAEPITRKAHGFEVAE